MGDQLNDDLGGLPQPRGRKSFASLIVRLDRRETSIPDVNTWARSFRARLLSGYSKRMQLMSPCIKLVPLILIVFANWTQS